MIRSDDHLGHCYPLDCRRRLRRPRHRHRVGGKCYRPLLRSLLGVPLI